MMTFYGGYNIEVEGLTRFSKKTLQLEPSLLYPYAVVAGDVTFL